MEKTYDKVVQYVKSEILQGNLKPGDKLESERDLALRLDSSRNSVREGLRLLENMGVLTSQHGSGNYISLNFDETMTEVLSFMYLMKGFDEDEITGFRRAIEWEAMTLAVKRADVEQKRQIAEELKGLEAATTEEDRVRHDRAIHQIMVAASGNELLIMNYHGLTNFMDRYIATMRTRIIAGMKSRNMLAKTHRMLVEGIVEGDLQKGLQGLRDHFGYIETYKDYKDDGNE